MAFGTTWRYWLFGDPAPHVWTPGTALPPNTDWTKLDFLRQFFAAIKERARFPNQLPWAIEALPTLDVGTDLQDSFFWRKLFIAAYILLDSEYWVHPKYFSLESFMFPYYKYLYGLEPPPFSYKLYQDLKNLRHGLYLRPLEWLQHLRDDIDLCACALAYDGTWDGEYIHLWGGNYEYYPISTYKSSGWFDPFVPEGFPDFYFTGISDGARLILPNPDGLTYDYKLLIWVEAYYSQNYHFDFWDRGWEDRYVYTLHSGSTSDTEMLFPGLFPSRTPDFFSYVGATGQVLIRPHYSLRSWEE